MDKEKMLKTLTVLINECWWIGCRGHHTKTGKAIVIKRLNQLSKALGHGKLSPEELRQITCYAGIDG